MIKEEFHEHLSLEMLKDVHINNTQEIKFLKKQRFEDKIINLLSITPSTVTVIIIIIFLVTINLKRRRNKLIIHNQHPVKEVSQVDPNKSKEQDEVNPNYSTVKEILSNSHPNPKYSTIKEILSNNHPIALQRTTYKSSFS